MNGHRTLIRTIAALAASLLLAFSVGAEPGKPTVIKRHVKDHGQVYDLAAVIVPANSPVRYKGAAKASAEIAEFEGRFVLSGKYYYGWDGALGQWRTIIEPDKAVPASLPSFEEAGGAREIYLDNPQDFARGVLSKAQFARVSRRHGSASGRTAIWADGLSAFVQCGYPWYAARFISDVKPAPVLLAKAREFDAC